MTGLFWNVCTVSLRSCPYSSLRRASVNWTTAWVIADLHTKEKLKMSQDEFCLQNSYCKALVAKLFQEVACQALGHIQNLILCKFPKWICAGGAEYQNYVWELPKKKILGTTCREFGENSSLRPVIDNTCLWDTAVCLR